MQTADPAALGLCPQRLARLRQVFQAEIDRQRLPGAVMVVARHGQTAVFARWVCKTRSPARRWPTTACSASTP